MLKNSTIYITNDIFNYIYIVFVLLCLNNINKQT